jgi:hypothetical protein
VFGGRGCDEMSATRPWNKKTSYLFFVAVVSKQRWQILAALM